MLLFALTFVLVHGNIRFFEHFVIRRGNFIYEAAAHGEPQRHMLSIVQHGFGAVLRLLKLRELLPQRFFAFFFEGQDKFIAAVTCSKAARPRSFLRSLLRK